MARRLSSRHKHGVVAPVVVMAVGVAMVAGVAWGAPPTGSGGQGSKKPTATVTVTKTVTATATSWATATATVPGPTATVTAPGPTKTVTATTTVPGPTSTVTVPGPTTTVTVTGAPTSSAPTSSAPTSSAPTSSAPTSSAPTATSTATASQPPSDSGSLCTPTTAWRSWTNEVYDWTDNNSGPMGEYYVSADLFNDTDQTQRTVYCSRTPDGNSPYFYAQATTRAGADGSVKSYPNAHMDFHHWGNNTEPSISDVDRNPATPNVLTTTFAHQTPATCTGCSYDWAHELWLNDYAVEVMIWTDWKVQHPSFADATKVETVTVDGRSWEVWRAVWGGTGTSRDGYIVFLPANGQPITSGTFNDLAFLNYLKGKGWLGTAPTLSAVTYGVEICQTGGQTKRFDVTNFSVSPLPHLAY